MRNKYLIRLDDACPTMDSQKWGRMEQILDKYGIKPMAGIIPHNEDPDQLIDNPDIVFWDKMKSWEAKGWALALHGFNHCLTSNKGMSGLNPMWARSEFAGESLDVQKQKIGDGVTILKQNGINPKYFFAPAHTYDANTLKALKECSDIRMISDTIATMPYRDGDFVMIPQLGGHCSEMKIPGIWTFCLHPSTMKDANFEATEAFINAHQDEFISFSDLDLENIGGKTLLGRLLSFAYFISRKLRGIK